MSFRPRKNPAYMGVQYVDETRSARQEEQRIARVRQQTARFHREKHLSAKLDELLGSIDDDYPPLEGEP